MARMDKCIHAEKILNEYCTKGKRFCTGYGYCSAEHFEEIERGEVKMIEPVKVLNMDEVNDARNILAEELANKEIERINNFLTVYWFSDHDYLEHVLNLKSTIMDYVVNILKDVYTEAGWKVNVIHVDSKGGLACNKLRFEII